MKIGVPRESAPEERRVALVPSAVPKLAKAGFEVLIEAGAGTEAGFSDDDYRDKNCRIVDRSEVYGADVVLSVRTLGANPEFAADVDLLREGSVLIGLCEPLSEPEAVQTAAAQRVAVLALELVPRITRAQAMDVLSSMASLAGYKAVLLAASELPKIFPMMMTAAGTVPPARVFVVGAGVAGLQAIATARRLGAVVQAYDVRPAVKQEVESLGAKFVELPLETTEAEGEGGYAKKLDEQFYARQRELMTRVVAESDVVITTAAVPGKKAPVLVTSEMVRGMQPGAVIVDLAAERGGNCELTQPGRSIVEHGVHILGPMNLPSSVPRHASEMYARNISTVLLHIAPEGELALNFEDEIVRETLIARDGEVLHPRVRELLSLPTNPTSTRNES